MEKSRMTFQEKLARCSWKLFQHFEKLVRYHRFGNCLCSYETPLVLLKEKEGSVSWQAYHKDWSLGDLEYEAGDIVTRDGSDRHVIMSIDYDWLNMDVKCIKEPKVLPPIEEGDVPWIRLGEVESNLIRRYQLVRKGKGSAIRLADKMMGEKP
jgi:hypothetical protein